MASEWQSVTLAEICREVRYGFTASATQTQTGTHFLRVTDIAKGPVNWAEVPFCEISNADYERYSLEPGDIVIARMGTIGVSALIRDRVRAVCASYLIRHRINEVLADARFVAYVLRSPSYWDFVWSHGSAGAVQPNINAKVLGEFRFRIPPLPEQRAIAHVLGTLDEKIELLRQQNETLEKIARALFKAWFVDFEPVRAKIEGRWQRGQTLPGLSSHLYDVFPDRLVDSELGKIPEGWKVVRAGQIYDVGIGKTPPRKESEWFSEDPEDVPWMSIKDLGRAGLFIAEVSEYLTPAAVERFRVRRIPDGTVVLSFKLTVGRVAITDGEMVSNEAIAHFLPKVGNHICPAYLYCYLRQFDYESLGSTSSIATAVNSDSVRSIPILVPGEPIGKAFESLAANSFRQIRTIQRESRVIALLRDTLLAKLTSGELCVPDAERIIGFAA